MAVVARLLGARSFEGKCYFRSLKSWRWKSVSASERALQYRVGEQIHGFTVKQVSVARRLCTDTFSPGWKAPT